MVTSAPSSSPGRNSRNPAKLATVRPAAKATIAQMIRDRLVIGQLRASGQRASPRAHGAGPGCAHPPEHSQAVVLVGGTTLPKPYGVKRSISPGSPMKFLRARTSVVYG